MRDPLEAVYLRLKEAERLGLRITSWAFTEAEWTMFFVRFNPGDLPDGHRYAFCGIPITRTVTRR